MYDYNEVDFIEPDQEQHVMIAHSKDYVVVLHFSDGIKDLLNGEGLSNTAIQNLFNLYKKSRKYKSDFKDLRGLDLDNNGNARATLNIQKKVKALSDVTDLFSNVNRDVQLNKRVSAQTLIP